MASEVRFKTLAAADPARYATLLKKEQDLVERRWKEYKSARADWRATVQTLCILTVLPATPLDELADLLPWNLDPATFHALTAEDARISLASIPIDRRDP